MEKLRRLQFEEIIKTLTPFAEAADRIEKALGNQALDNHPVRSGAELRLGDLRKARVIRDGLARELARR